MVEDAFTWSIITIQNKYWSILNFLKIIIINKLASWLLNWDSMLSVLFKVFHLAINKQLVVRDYFTMVLFILQSFSNHTMN